MEYLQKVSTCLWFNTEAEDAAKFYTSLFAGSRITADYAASSAAPAASPPSAAASVPTVKKS